MAPGSTGPAALPAIWQYWTGKRRMLVLEFSQPTQVAVGDVIYLPEGDARASQRPAAGGRSLRACWPMAAVCRGRDEVVEARALIYPTVGDWVRSRRWSINTKPDTLVWVDRSAAHTRAQGQHAAVRSAASHGSASGGNRGGLSAGHRAQPASTAGRARAGPSAAHSSGTGRSSRPGQPVIAAKSSTQELLPLVKSDVLPIVRQRAEPALREVGQELWQRVSLWRFGWRMAYDFLPCPKKT